ncbi:TPA: NADH-quinone oxidoreductase subunit B [Candidatus Bathyarchaeota archaeon]|nr:NADH-quinone oxidoreductase subunit B [Candidatus Bathyarchaeota archaeon]
MDFGKGRILIGRIEEFLRTGALYLVDNIGLVKKVRDWGITYSLWPVHFTTACCGCEVGAVAGPRFDIERHGVLPFFSPRQCNLLLVEGTLTRRMGRAARIVYEQMPEPKFVIAMGACAIEGGIFWNSYNIVRPYEILPVDVFIPGCPPRPEAVIQSVLMLKNKIRRKLRFGEWEKGEWPS